MIEVFSAVNPMGQGIATTLAQLVVDVFGVPIEKVRVVLGDTDRGDGFGSAGSRSLFTGGSALHLGAEKTLDQARSWRRRRWKPRPADIDYAPAASGEGHGRAHRPVRAGRPPAGAAHLH